MHTEYIRDYTTKLVIGIIEVLPNGDKVARDFSSRKVLGFFRAKTNRTTDFYGRVLCEGDFLTKVFENKERK